MDVILETPRGKSFTIEVGFFDTVLEIKEKIQRYQGIAIQRQTLVFNGHVLEDESNVEKCEILQDSHIQLLISPPSTTRHSDAKNVIEHGQDGDKNDSPTPPPKENVRLRIKIPSTEFRFPLEMNFNDTIAQLKERINSEIERNIPINKLVLHSIDGLELQDQLHLNEYDLMDNSEIDVNIRPSPKATSPGSVGLAGGSAPSNKKLKVMVLPKSGTTKIPVEVNASDNVGELRKELQKLHQHPNNFELPQEGYFFIYKQNVMDDDRSFKWHHVSSGDTIEIFNGSVSTSGP